MSDMQDHRWHYPMGGLEPNGRGGGLKTVPERTPQAPLLLNTLADIKYVIPCHAFDADWTLMRNIIFDLKPSYSFQHRRVSSSDPSEQVTATQQFALGSSRHTDWEKIRRGPALKSATTPDAQKLISIPGINFACSATKWRPIRSGGFWISCIFIISFFPHYFSCIYFLSWCFFCAQQEQYSLVALNRTVAT